MNEHTAKLAGEVEGRRFHTPEEGQTQRGSAVNSCPAHCRRTAPRCRKRESSRELKGPVSRAFRAHLARAEAELEVSQRGSAGRYKRCQGLARLRAITELCAWVRHPERDNAGQVGYMEREGRKPAQTRTRLRNCNFSNSSRHFCRVAEKK